MTDFPNERGTVRYLKRDTGKRVVVQLETVTWTGTLIQCGRDHITLGEAAAGVSAPRSADGHLVIPALGIQYVQVLD